MPRLIDRIFFPELFGEHHLFAADGVDIFERRIYRLLNRRTINNWDDIDFFVRFRLTKPVFVELLAMVSPALAQNENRSRIIQPEQQLLIALRFFASGSMQMVVADVVGVCAASVCNHLPLVCDAIIALLPNFIKMPQSAAECREKAAEFRSIAGLTTVIGAIDCTHVKIQSPGGPQAENFRNRKGFFSLNVQTISDKSLRILDVVARWPGGSHDQTIFINSAIHQRLDRGDFGAYVLVGDSGYRNTTFLATPFTAAHGNRDEATRQYNRSIISTRNVVERQYGVWKRRFPVLAYGMRLKIQTCQKVIVACAVLHNLAINRNEPSHEDDERIVRAINETAGNEENVHDNFMPNRNGVLARDRMIARIRQRLQ